MKVLITGGAGFLGRAFWRHHWDQNDDIVSVDDLSNPDSWWPGVGTVEDAGDFLRIEQRHFDLAYHFAAPVGGRMKIEGDPMFNADSLRLDSIFFRWAIKHVETVVYPSSSAVYGTALQGKDGLALAEGLFHPDNPDWNAPDEMYGFTKLAGEVMAWKSAAYGLNALCIRPFSGYGEDQSMDYPIPSIADRVARRQDPVTIWGSGLQRRDFIHISDVVGATIARLDAGVRGYQTMNIGSGISTSFSDIARGMSKLAHYYPKIESDPAKPEGVFNRWADTHRMAHYYEPKVSLTEGLRRVLRAKEKSIG